LDYVLAENQIKEIVLNNSNVLKNVVNYLFEKFNHYNWVGIYFVEGKDLVLGPWKGPHATEHTRIPIGKGICGSAAANGKTEVINNVSSDDRYLACFVTTKSEIVVPIKKNDKILGEIDIDSDKREAFTKKDEIFLEKIADMLVKHI